MTFIRTRYRQNQHLWWHFGVRKSRGLRGVFQLMKKVNFRRILTFCCSWEVPARSTMQRPDACLTSTKYAYMRELYYVYSTSLHAKNGAISYLTLTCAEAWYAGRTYLKSSDFSCHHFSEVIRLLLQHFPTESSPLTGSLIACKQGQLCLSIWNHWICFDSNLGLRLLR